MYQSGKVHQVAKVMQRLHLAVLGASETRWLGCGKMQLITGETLFFSGLTSASVCSAPHEKGVALMLSKQTAKSINETGTDLAVESEELVTSRAVIKRSGRQVKV